MKLKQISVFLENTSGALTKVMDIIQKEQIQLIATTIAETQDYGILRLICREPSAALSKLKDAGLAVSICEVSAVDIDKTSDQMNRLIAEVTKESCSISYLYAFHTGEKGLLFVKTDDIEKTEDIIRRTGCSCSLNEN